MDSASGTTSSFVSGNKILCAIISHAKSTRRGTLRNTWVPLVPQGVDVMFFVGAQDGELEDGVVNLHCCDNHEGIPDKIRALCIWAIAHGYTYLWKCDDDVQLLTIKLTEIQHPFTGVVLPASYPKISGFLYGFNRECMEVLSKSDVPHYENGWDCGYYQDEYWAMDKLGKIGVAPHLITDCKVIYNPSDTCFHPFWVVAVHGENVSGRSFIAFRQIHGLDKPISITRRLGRRHV